MTFFLVIGVFYSFNYCRQEKMCDIIIYRKSDLAPVQIALWVEHQTIDISEARVQIWSGPSAIFSNPVHVNGESDCACIQLNWWGRGRGVVRMFHCLLAFLIVWGFFFSLGQGCIFLIKILKEIEIREEKFYMKLE